MAKILGDINPAGPRQPMPEPDRDRSDMDRDPEDEQSMVGGSQHDRTKHSGSRDVNDFISFVIGSDLCW